jgi:predicted DCC family thiol-disulfide oxidoreductase YuxK
MADSQVSILFYDGVCALCNGAVRFFARRHPQVQFAPLQGTTAQHHVPDSMRHNMDTVVLLHHGQLFTQTEVTLELLKDMKPAWRWMGKLLALIPTSLRDAVYRWIARNRYRWFGKYDQCPLPPADLKQRFLP